MRVDNLPIRRAVERYIREDHTWGEICRTLGWTRTVDGKPDTTRLKRSLGLATEKRRKNGKLKKLTTKSMNSKTAIQIIRAIERNPNEFGL